MAGFTTSIAEVYKAIRRALMRNGVKIGGTASYPRVEIHSVTEEAPADKDYRVRGVTVTIEAVSDEKIADVVNLVEGNIAKLFDAAGLSMTDYDFIGLAEGQVRMFQEQESTDSAKVIYRILQDVTIWIEKKQI